MTVAADHAIGFSSNNWATMVESRYARTRTITLFSEIHRPAVALVEAHAILGRRQRMKFDYGLVTLYDQILRVQLRALRENLTQLGERTVDKGFLAWVMAGQGMRSHQRSSPRRQPPVRRAQPRRRSIVL